MKTTGEYATAVIAPDRDLADRLVVTLKANGFRAEVIQRRSTWVHTDAPARKVNQLIVGAARLT